MSPAIDASPQELIRVEYVDMYTPTAGGAKIARTMAPAVLINVRNPGGAAAGREEVVRARGLLDTGAGVSAMPLWAAEQLGIALNEKSLQPAFGASGGFEAYSVRVCIEAQMGGSWIDVGVVEALVPDTEPSRRPDSRVPFLLGRDGFIDKCSACFDEAERTAWLRRAGGGPAAPRPVQ